MQVNNIAISKIKVEQVKPVHGVILNSMPRENSYITVHYIDIKKFIQKVHTLFDYNFCNIKVISHH